MKKQLIFILFTLSSSLVFASDYAKSDNQQSKNKPDLKEISWYKHDFPPYFIINDPEKGQGILDLFYPYLVESLPNYTHSFFITNNSGFFKRVESGHNVCAFSVMKTEDRAKELYFSEPYVYVLQNALFIRIEDADRFLNYTDSNGKILFSEVIEDQSLILGAKQGVSYGKEFDRIIREHINNKNVVIRKGKDLSEGLLKMLQLKRIDYMIAYDESFKYLLKKLNMESEYLYIPIAEMSDKNLNMVGISCTKNDWGRIIVEEFNKVIITNELHLKSKQLYMDWLSENAKREYVRILSKNYGDTN